jgi:predicted MPP superfamily phosphohydrolase
VNRLLHPFVLGATALLALFYAYIALRLGSEAWHRAALAIPFVLVWWVPGVYWGRTRRDETLRERIVLQASYLSMGWLSFLAVLTLARDALLLATAWVAALAPVHAFLRDAGPKTVLAGSLLALLIGFARALARPRVREVRVDLPDLHEDLVGFTIAQVSDLHVGRAIRAPYVRRVVAITKALKADLVALTGDMVDGPVQRLADDVAALGELAAGGRGYFVLGNHDCYAGAGPWSAHFRKLGFRVLLNEHVTIEHGRARVVIAGVLDPALRPGPQPQLAAANAPPAALRLLLAHNPKAAPDAARAGFDLQLSGHTHGGQFFPWTLVVRHVHAPHSEGLSREGSMWVYVSPGTGTWGPLVRFGTRPEVTLIRLRRARA